MNLRQCATVISKNQLVLLVLLSASMSCAAAEAQRAVNGSIGVGSDYTFRGVSQTLAGHAIQASLDVDLPAGFYAYAWGSNVDFVPAGEPDDGASYEVDLAAGYRADINENWNIDLALIRYLFPGTTDDIDYDYNELMTTLTYAETYSATIAYSDNVDGTGAESFFYELGVNVDLVADMTLAMHYGHYDISKAYGTAYSYAETSLARQYGDTTITLSYSNTNDAADLIFNQRATGSRFVLSLQLDW